MMKEERKKRTIRLAIWTWTWVATLAVATFGPKFHLGKQYTMDNFGNMY
jgi:hypothetical protein